MYYSPQDLQNSPELVKHNYIFIKDQKYIIPEGKIWIMKLKIFHLKLSKNMTNVKYFLLLSPIFNHTPDLKKLTLRSS